MHCIVVYRDTAHALISNTIFHCVYHQDISGMISTHFVERLRVNWTAELINLKYKIDN